VTAGGTDDDEQALSHFSILAQEVLKCETLRAAS